MTRDAIYGACIARQVFDHMQAGKGAPTDGDMERFAEEASAVADLWSGVVPDEPEDTTDRILCAAIWFQTHEAHTHQPENTMTGFVLSGHRHHAIIEAAYRAKIPKSLQTVQGFLTVKNRFLNRAQAMKLAKANGQVPASSSGSKLFSEDIY